MLVYNTTESYVELLIHGATHMTHLEVEVVSGVEGEAAHKAVWLVSCFFMFSAHAGSIGHRYGAISINVVHCIATMCATVIVTSIKHQ